MTDAERTAQLEELAAAHRFLAVEGHEDRTSGHLSWRDPDGRGFWMKRSHIGMDEAMSAADMILVDWDGKTIAGTGSRHYEWPIHAEILRVRPDVHAVGHTHAFYSQIFASTNEPLRAIGKEGAWFDDQPKFQETCSLIRTPELGVRVAQDARRGRRGVLDEPRHRVCGQRHPRMHDGRDLSRGGRPRAMYDRDDRIPLYVADRRRRQGEARADADAERDQQLLGVHGAARRRYAEGGFSAYGLISALASNDFEIVLYLNATSISG